LGEFDGIIIEENGHEEGRDIMRQKRED
jgi:hypothetical protein